MSARRNLVLKQHFTDAQPINSLMCHLLGDVSGLKVLEPCVGHGAFLDGLLGTPSKIDAIDVDGNALKVVKEKFNWPNIELFEEDFINLFVEQMSGSCHPVRTQKYDAVIANPPYGLYFDIEYRRKIKKVFPNLYARESYGLFFAFAISCLKKGGKYSFLMPDTFLSSINHKPLRNFICSQAAPTHIIRFPSKVFETVKFGYGNLCIIVGNKKPLSDVDVVQWIDAFEDKTLHVDIINNSKKVLGSALTCAAEFGWSSSIGNVQITKGDGWRTLGDIAECRTGIYTGNNECFIGYDAHRVTKRLNGHSIDWKNQICNRPISKIEVQDGIECEPSYVPLIRGGHRDPFARTAWAIRWDKPAVTFYKTDKKARFQNSSFYFREGLSIPMVTTARISASVMKNAVFDQGVVGVFPKNKNVTSSLLLYLNSSYASKLMKDIVNGGANNSANYLKRLPVPNFDESEMENAERIIETARKHNRTIENECENFVQNLKNLPI